MLGVTGFVLASGIAYADPARAPRFIEGNVTDREEAGLGGTILFGSAPDNDPETEAGSGTVSGDGEVLAVTRRTRAGLRRSATGSSAA